MIIFNRRRKIKERKIKERIIKALGVSDMSGYYLSKKIQVNAGSIYIALYELEQEGVVGAYWEENETGYPRRRFYHLIER